MNVERREEATEQREGRESKLCGYAPSHSRVPTGQDQIEMHDWRRWFAEPIGGLYVIPCYTSPPPGTGTS